HVGQAVTAVSRKPNGIHRAAKWPPVWVRGAGGHGGVTKAKWHSPRGQVATRLSSRGPGGHGGVTEAKWHSPCAQVSNPAEHVGRRSQRCHESQMAFIARPSGHPWETGPTGGGLSRPLVRGRWREPG